MSDIALVSTEDLITEIQIRSLNTIILLERKGEGLREVSEFTFRYSGSNTGMLGLMKQGTYFITKELLKSAKDL